MNCPGTVGVTVGVQLFGLFKLEPVHAHPAQFPGLVRLVLSPIQIDGGVEVAVGVGLGFTVTVSKPKAIQPLASVTITV